MKKRILLVEDEEHLRDTIALNLKLEGYDVIDVGDGLSALNKFKEMPFDLIILDVMLPEIDGYALCQKIRADNNLVPILFLTAKGTSKDKVYGLKLGADDYLGKPFDLEEFLLRVKSLVKRSNAQHSSDDIEFKFGGNSVNFSTYAVSNAQGDELTFSQKEIKLLRLLVDHQDKVVSRNQILEMVWGVSRYPSTRTIDNFIVTFRRFFEQDPKKPIHFQSVRGVGYKFVK
ncbi:MAG: response regulator transcription factor [Flavobacteriales bacterium]|nr:response regulator transcription factor [Flavobacteriales bacterium]